VSHFKNKQNVNCVAEPQESQALLDILIIILNLTYEFDMMMLEFASYGD
jgi:hypothetical protein